MAEEPSAGQPREGLFLPDLDKISKSWQAKLDGLTTQLLEESAAWQRKVDNLTELVETLIAELQDLNGVTVRVDRRSDAVPE